MQNAYKEVERLLGDLANIANCAKADRLVDQISVLCRGYMDVPSLSDVTDELRGAGFTSGEARIVDLLRVKINKIVTRDQMLDALCYDGKGEGIAPKNIDVRLANIRKKLFHGGNQFWVETVWGQGWRMHNAPLPPAHIRVCPTAKGNVSQYRITAPHNSQAA